MNMDEKDIKDVGHWFKCWCTTYTEEFDGNVDRDEFIEDAASAIRYYLEYMA
jgi:hypothetical protein